MSIVHPEFQPQVNARDHQYILLQLDLCATQVPSAATGSAIFLDGPMVLGTAAIVNGSAALSVASLARGTHSIAAVYGGDVCCAASLSNVLTEIVTPPPPAAPSNLNATVISSTHVKLNWSASSTAGVTYQLYAGAISGFTPGPSNRVAASMVATSYSSTGLSPSSTYYFVVTAQNSGGESALRSRRAPPPNRLLPSTSTMTRARRGNGLHRAFPSPIRELGLRAARRGCDAQQRQWEQNHRRRSFAQRRTRQG